MSAWKSTVPTLVYVVYIFVAGSARGGGPPLELSDKVAHAVAFGLMVPFALLPLQRFWQRAGFAQKVGMAVVIASGLGALLELWQTLLPWRTADVLDWVADTMGAVVAGGGVLVLRLFIPKAGSGVV